MGAREAAADTRSTRVCLGDLLALGGSLLAMKLATEAPQGPHPQCSESFACVPLILFCMHGPPIRLLAWRDDMYHVHDIADASFSFYRSPTRIQLYV